MNATDGATVRAYPGFIEQLSVIKVLTTDATGFYTGHEAPAPGCSTGGSRWTGRR